MGLCINGFCTIFETVDELLGAHPPNYQEEGSGDTVILRVYTCVQACLIFIELTGNFQF